MPNTSGLLQSSFIGGDDHMLRSQSYVPGGGPGNLSMIRHSALRGSALGKNSYIRPSVAHCKISKIPLKFFFENPYGNLFFQIFN